MTVTVSFGEASIVRPLLPIDSPGSYAAEIVPTQPGTYALQITGELAGETLDIASTCSDESFHCVADAGEVEFPSRVAGASAASGADGSAGTGLGISTGDRRTGAQHRRCHRGCGGGSAISSLRDTRLRRSRRAAVALGVTLVVGVVGAAPAAAHAVLVVSNPAAGSAVEASPTAIVLTFSEEPEPSLAEITLTDAAAVPIPLESPVSVPGDPRSLSARVPALDEGIYTIAWRVVSRIDGHPTAGVHVRGGHHPGAGGDRGGGAGCHPVASRQRGRGPLAPPRGAGGPARGDLRRAVWVRQGEERPAARRDRVADRRRRTRAPGARAAEELGRPSRRVPRHVRRKCHPRTSPRPRRRRHRAGDGPHTAVGTVEGAAALARGGSTAATIGVHVVAGHAAAASGSARWLAITGQWAHFVAVGVWIGGLAALLLGVRGAPSDEKAGAVRRFSTAAALALTLVVLTGLARSVDAIGSVGGPEVERLRAGRDGQGGPHRAVATLGLRNRLRSVPQADSTLRPLRRVSRGELSVAVLAVGAAAILGSLSPPVELDPLGLSVEGRDTAGTVEAHLTTQWAVPGPTTSR